MLISRADLIKALDCLEGPLLATLLKTLKHITMSPGSLENLQRLGLIPTLVRLLASQLSVADKPTVSSSLSIFALSNARRISSVPLSAPCTIFAACLRSVKRKLLRLARFQRSSDSSPPALSSSNSLYRSFATLRRRARAVGHYFGNTRASTSTSVCCVSRTGA